MAPRITITDPQFQVPTVALPSPGTAAADVLAGAQKVAEDTVVSLEKRSLKRAQINGSLKIAKAKAEIEDFIETEHNEGRSGPGFAQAVDDRLAAKAQELRDSAEDDNERDFMELGLSDIAATAHSRSKGYEAAANHAQQVGSLIELGNTWAAMVEKDPSKFAEGAMTVSAAVKAHGGSLEEQAKLQREMVEDLALSAVYGAGPPEVGQEILDSGKLDAFIGSKQKHTAMEYLRSKEAQKYTDAARADVENTRLRHEQRKQFYKDYAKAKNRGERMDLFDKALEGDFLEPSDITAFTEGFQGVSPTGSDPGTINDLTKRRRDGEDVGGLAIKRHAQHLINDTDLKYFSDDSRNDSPGSWRQQARQALKAAFSGEDNDDPARQALFMELDKRLIGIAEQHPDWTNEKAKPVWNAVVALAQEIAPPPPANAVTKGGKIDEMATLKNNVDKWKESHPNGDMLEFKQTQEYKNLEKRMKEYLKYERLRDIYESAIRKGEQ